MAGLLVLPAASPARAQTPNCGATTHLRQGDVTVASDLVKGARTYYACSKKDGKRQSIATDQYVGTRVGWKSVKASLSGRVVFLRYAQTVGNVQASCTRTLDLDTGKRAAQCIA